MTREERTTLRQPEHTPASGSPDRSQGVANKQAVGPGVTEVRTSDPNIVSPEPTPQPDRAVTYETSQLSGPAAAYPFGCAGGVEQRSGANGKKQHDGEDEEQQESKPHKKKHEHKTHDEGHGHKKDHQDRRHEHDPRHEKHKKQHPRLKLPGWPALLITAVLALVCGAGGAWGYSALFGSDPPHLAKGFGKADKGTKAGGGKSGASDSGQDTSDNLKKEVQQLADNIDELGTRIDRLNQAAQESRMPVPQYYPGSSRIERMAPANDGSAPIPSGSQTQLTVLEHKVDQMEDLPDRVQELERRVTELQEAIKVLVDARAASERAGQ